MAITSVGYDGAVSETQWSDMIKKVGSSDYGVVGMGDFKVAAVSGSTRTVSIADGKAWGHGVFDEMDANTSIQLDSVGSGSRWDLIALRRDWTGTAGSTTVVKVNGSSSRAIPAGRSKGPGTVDDQPLALVRISAGESQPTDVVDLRCWSGNGGMVANSSLALTYLDTLGASVYVGAASKHYNRIIGDDGNSRWTAGTETGGLELFGKNNSLNGGTPETGTKFLVQAGTNVQRFDNDGYATIYWPTPFPNGLLYVSGFNGDNHAFGGAMTYASAGSNKGSEGLGHRFSWTYAGRATSEHDIDSAVEARMWCAGKLHRINWMAIGW